MPTDQPTPAPDHLGLGQVIARLTAEPDQDRRVPVGFHEPHSYRGDYWDLAFEVAHDVTVGEMLAAARSALGATFQGWKGGDFTMGEHTSVWLVTEQGDCGESLGAVLLSLLLAPTADVDAAYERGKAEQAAEIEQWRAAFGGDALRNATAVLEERARLRAEVERLQALLDHAEQHARDLQDGEGWDRDEEWALSYTLNGTPQEPGHGGHVFDSRAEAQRHIEAWQRNYPDLTYADVKYHRREILTGEWQPETGAPDA